MPRVRVTHKSDLPQYFKERGLTLKNSVPGLLRQAGRLAAVSLAFQTQPFGDSDTSEALGKVATNRDIYKVYTTPGKAYEDLPATATRPGKKLGTDRKLNPQSIFWNAVTARQWGRAQKILADFGVKFKNTPILPFDGGTQHRKLRNNQGRIAGAQQPVMIVQNTTPLKTYVDAEMKKAGYGKGGWASCARALGGIRGIPRWVHKHHSPGIVIENYGGQPMSITLINQVPYASSILSPSGKADAVRIAVDRLRRSIQIAARGRRPPAIT